MRGSREDLERAFGAIAEIQPVDWSAHGLICCPRAAPEVAADALSDCPFPVAASDEVHAWPQPEARMLAGWYVRGIEHVASPGRGDLVQTTGDGFGPGGHATTAMCLSALHRMPAAPALDVGCGSGLLSQAWVHAKRESVLGCDPNHAAIAQARASVEAAGIASQVEFRQTRVQQLAETDFTGRVLLANLPAQQHRSLLGRLMTPPPGVVASGIHGRDALMIRAGYQRLGMRVVSAARRGRWHCWGLVAR